MGNRCQPSQTGSRNPPASVPKSAAALLLSQITTTKDSSPPFCPGFNSLPAHLSWAIKHTRDKPRNPPQRWVLFRGAGRGKAPSSPRAGGCPPACCLHQGGRQPRRNCCGFILPVQGDGELWEERRGARQGPEELLTTGGRWQHCTAALLRGDEEQFTFCHGARDPHVLAGCRDLSAQLSTAARPCSSAAVRSRREFSVSR